MPNPQGAHRPYNVLFICTGNSARSIMAEAILSRLGEGRFAAYSAGSKPRGAVNPYAMRLLQKLDYDTSALRSKSWDEFSGPEAPEFDFIFTLCDEAAGEVCPVWAGHPQTAHWGLPDPAAAGGSPSEVALAFDRTYGMLHNRLAAFVALPFAALDRASLLNHLQQISKVHA
jgi:arsenate reductase